MQRCIALFHNGLFNIVISVSYTHLDRNEALKAITIYPAQITGIADRVGSIEPGKDADIVIFSGDPLSVCDTPDMVIVNGTVI